MRGSTAGSLWGLVIGGFGLGFVSLASEQPGLASSSDASELAVAQTPLEESVQDATGADVSDTAATPVVVEDSVPDIVATAPDVWVQIIADMQPPQTTSLPQLAVTMRAPSMPTTAFAAPQMVSMPPNPMIDTAPAAPWVAPVAAEDESVVEPEVVDETPMVQAQGTEPVAPVIIAPEAEDVIAVQQQLPSSPASQVRVNRLTLSDEDAATAPVEVAGDPAPALEADAPALLRNAAVFENPENLPLIGIILIDDGMVVDPVTAIGTLGFAPTVATNVLASDAQARVAALRDAGAEVAMQIALPQGARPADVEVTFEAASAAMTEAAMLFSDGTGVIQNDRAVTAQVMQVLSDNGQGFVTVQRGLGNAARATDQVDVPAVTVLRDLDGNGESQAAIGRTLDQAAFRARQSGSAVLMGRMTPQTMAALAEWAAGAQSDGIAVAPVSALLLETP